MIAAAESVISVVSSSIALAFSISLASDCRYSSSSAEISLRPCTIFSSVREIACSVFSTNFRRAMRAGGDRLVGIDHEGIDERCHRLKLRRRPFLAPNWTAWSSKSSALLGRSSSLKRNVVPLRASWFCAISALSSLTLTMSAKILVKAWNSRCQLRDLIQSRRVGGALHRLIDGLLQAGFGRERRLGVFFLARHHIISCQRAVGDQLAVDIAGQIGLRHAGAVGGDAGETRSKPR